MINEIKPKRPSTLTVDAICDLAHVIVRDLDDRVMFWSERDAEVYGWKATDAVGRDCNELLKSEFPETLSRILDTVESEGRWEGDVLHRRRDDSEVHVHSVWVPSRDQHGEMVALIEINHDMTRQREIERELRERDREFRVFFELSGVGNVMTCPKTGRFLRVNKTFCEITGRTEDELARLTARELTHPDDRERDEAGWKSAMETGEPHFSIEKRYVRGNGDPIWVSVTSTIVRDEAGSPLCALGVVTDIDARRRANAEIDNARKALEHRVDERTQALAEANADLNREVETRRQIASRLTQTNQMLATLIQAAPIVIIGTDRDGVIELWNPEAALQFGIPATGAHGVRLLDMPIRWTQRSAIRSLLGDVPMNITATFRTEGDETRDFSIWSAPTTDPNGDCDGHVLLAIDETVKRFLEGAILDAGVREQRRIGQELHDHLCQQLLGAAFGAQALARELERMESASAPRATALARLINDSVMHARNMARGINPIELEDPAALMSALHEMAARVPTGVHVDFDCNEPVLVADAGIAFHIFRIVQEAVTNAIRHGGADQLRIVLSKCEDEVTLEIIDNGRATGTDESRDLNLGIELMKYRARAIHGELAIVSLGERGTSVTCKFPNHSSESHANH